METFTGPRDLVINPDFLAQKQIALSSLRTEMIDAPVLDLVDSLNALSFCFTIQSCYGHFLHAGQDGEENLEPLPEEEVEGAIDYRIAYIALCVDNDLPGYNFLRFLESVAGSDPEYIQFGSADWFWERQVNSFVLQVEPERFMERDRMMLDYGEARKVEKKRNGLFKTLRSI